MGNQIFPGSFEYYAPQVQSMQLYPGIYSTDPNEFYKIKDMDLLRAEVFQLYNNPFNLNIGSVYGFDINEYDNNAMFELPHKKSQIYNTHDYSKITKSISDRIETRYNELMGFCPVDDINIKIVAYRFRYRFPSNTFITEDSIIKMLSDITKIVQNFIVCSQLRYDFDISSPSLHFIISNACTYFGNSKKMNYMFSKSMEFRIQRIEDVFYMRANNIPVYKQDLRV